MLRNFLARHRILIVAGAGLAAAAGAATLTLINSGAAPDVVSEAPPSAAPRGFSASTATATIVDWGSATYLQPPIDAPEKERLEDFSVEARCTGAFNRSNYDVERDLANGITRRRVRGCDSETYIAAHRGIHTVKSRLIYNNLGEVLVDEKFPTYGGDVSIGTGWNCVQFNERAIAEQSELGKNGTAQCNDAYKWKPEIWEIDPRRTRDGKWVLNHDSTLNRQFVLADLPQYAAYSPVYHSPSTAGQLSHIPPIQVSSLDYSQISSLRQAVWDRPGNQFALPRSEKVPLLFDFVRDYAWPYVGPSVYQLHIRSLPDITEIAQRFNELSNTKLPNNGFTYGKRLKYTWFTIHLSDLCNELKKNEFFNTLTVGEKLTLFSVIKVLKDKNVRSSVGCLALFPAIKRYVSVKSNIDSSNIDAPVKLQVNIFNDTDFTGAVRDPWTGELVSARIAAVHGIFTADGPVVGTHARPAHGGLTFLGFDDTNFSSNNVAGIAQIGSWAHRNGYLVLRTDLYPDSTLLQRNGECFINTEGYPWDVKKAWCPSYQQFLRGANPAFMTGRQSDPNNEFGYLVRPDIWLTDAPGRARNYLNTYR